MKANPQMGVIGGGTTVCALLDIKKTRTTAYHPQSDGLVERFNRTLYVEYDGEGRRTGVGPSPTNSAVSLSDQSSCHNWSNTF